MKHGLAVWDTIGACDIKGASDASIRNAVPNDVAALIRKLGVRAVFCNGAASGRIYAKYAEPLTRPARRRAAQHQPRQRGMVPGPPASRPGAQHWHRFCTLNGCNVTGFCSIIRSYLLY